jgi:hypothetical protein
MLIPPACNPFVDDCFDALDLNRFRNFINENFNEPSSTSVSTSTSMSPSSLLMDIVRRDEGANEQDLKHFHPDLLKPLQHLPPGKLPGVAFDPTTSTNSLPTSIFSSSFASGNSPKRRKVTSSSPQNITIQHF